MPDYRTAGIFLLLTALATAISVPARLIAGADDTPLADAVAQSRNLDTAMIAQLELSERLSAIGSAKVPYGIGGAARLIGGLTLLAAGLLLWRVLRAYQPAAMGLAAALLVASGIASAVSGACAIALAVLAPEAQSTAVLRSAGALVPGTEEMLFTIRWAAGTLGFTLAGLALVALAAVQWRMGSILRVSGVVGVVLGVAMLFIWIDAATVVHRISGIAFLIWLTVAGLWLVVPRLRSLGTATPSPSP
jgi:hypothetical protein